MALVLTIAEDGDFRVDGVRCKVIMVESEQRRCRLVVSRAEDPVEFLITEHRRVEILPDVFVSVGNPKDIRYGTTGKRIALSIEAPRSINIVRGEVLEARRRYH